MAIEADQSTATRVLRQLRDAGYQALFAGGCVRDMLLGRTPKDYDIATDATPVDVQRVFGRVLLVGAQFGVAVVLMADEQGIDRQVEVATFRSDAAYTDGRRPEAVTFSTPAEDAARRDFTINGMFQDPISEEVIDYVGGQDDLRAGLVRTIGDPNERFAEDYLRLVRAVRFAAGLGFRLQPATASALRRHAPHIVHISGERIFDELTKMLGHPSACEAMHMLLEYQLLPHLLPELFRPNDERWLRAWQRLCRLPCNDDPALNFAALLMDLPKADIARVARRWGASNPWKRSMQWFAAHADDWRAGPDLSLCELKRLMQHGQDWYTLRVLWAVREKIADNSHAATDAVAARAAAVAPDAVNPPPLITGEDLKQLGLSEGRQLGQVLRDIRNAQLNEELTTREDALQQVTAILKQ